MSQQYFDHDLHTRNKRKMAALLHEEGAKGYGLFWIIVEMLHESTDKWMELDNFSFLAISKESGISFQKVEAFVNKCIQHFEIFIQDGNRFTTERVLRHTDKRKEIKEKRSTAGKKSGEKRQQNSTHVEQVLNTCSMVDEQKPTKEIKEKEIKRNNYYVVSDETENLLSVDEGLKVNWVGKGLSLADYEKGIKLWRIQNQYEEYKKFSDARKHFLFWMPNYPKAAEQVIIGHPPQPTMKNGIETAKKYD